MCAHFAADLENTIQITHTLTRTRQQDFKTNTFFNVDILILKVIIGGMHLNFIFCMYIVKCIVYCIYGTVWYKLYFMLYTGRFKRVNLPFSIYIIL